MTFGLDQNTKIHPSTHPPTHTLLGPPGLPCPIMSERHVINYELPGYAAPPRFSPVTPRAPEHFGVGVLDEVIAETNFQPPRKFGDDVEGDDEDEPIKYGLNCCCSGFFFEMYVVSLILFYEHCFDDSKMSSE